MANMLVIEEGDEMVFTIDGEIVEIIFTEHVRLAWESVPGVFNTLSRNLGRVINAEISADTRRIIFKDPYPFTLDYMTYNLQLLFGWHPFTPIEAVEHEDWIERKSTDAPSIYADSFQAWWQILYFDSGAGHAPNSWYAVPDYTVFRFDGAYPNRYHIKWEITGWHTQDKTEWCKINADTGTIQLKREYDFEDTDDGMYVNYKGLLYNGGSIPEFEHSVQLYLFNCKVPNPIPAEWTEWEPSALICSKMTLIFGETQTMSIRPRYRCNAGRVKGCCYKISSVTWEMEDTLHLSFVTPAVKYDGKWIAKDDGHAIQVKAGNVASPEHSPVYVICGWDEVGQDERQYAQVAITVINDLVPVTRYKVEAPAVGNPMSSPQLYLMSNVGNQVYRNTIDNPKMFDNATVLATIQNSFSPGYPIMASGESACQIPTSQLADLSFSLVDSYFHPIHLLNPLTLTIQVSPVLQNVNNDLSAWTGKLPKDAPTAEQRAEMQRQAELQHQKQAEQAAKESVAKEYADLANRYIVEFFGPRVNMERQQAVQQRQQEEFQFYVQEVMKDPTVLPTIAELPAEKAQQYIFERVNQVREHYAMMQRPMPTPEQQQQKQQEQEEQTSKEIVYQTVGRMTPSQKDAFAQTMGEEDQPMYVPEYNGPWLSPWRPAEKVMDPYLDID
jgi:hypothetical protein